MKDLNLDSDFIKTAKLARAGAVFTACLALVVLGVGVWAVIELVSHFTS